MRSSWAGQVLNRPRCEWQGNGALRDEARGVEAVSENANRSGERCLGDIRKGSEWGLL